MFFLWILRFTCLRQLPTVWAQLCFLVPPDHFKEQKYPCSFILEAWHHNRLEVHVLSHILLCIYGSFAFTQNEKRHSLQSTEQTTSVPPWRGGRQWPQHHRTPRFHEGRAGAHCGEQTAGAPSEIMGYTVKTILWRAHIETLKRKVQPKISLNFNSAL